MGNYSLLIILNLALSYMIPYIFIKLKTQDGIGKIMEEAKTYNNIENIIEIKKFEISKNEKINFMILGIGFTLFIGFKVTNLLSATAYIFFSLCMIALLSLSINLSKYYNILIKELYDLKDKVDKQ